MTGKVDEAAEHTSFVSTNGTYVTQANVCPDTNGQHRTRDSQSVTS